MIRNFHAALAALRPGERNPLIALIVSDEAATYRPEMQWLAHELQLQGKRVFCLRPEDIFPLENALFFDVEGNPLSADELKRRQDEWLPSAADRTYIHSLMQPVVERGKIVNWLAPPARGINGQAFDFEYVRK